MLTILLFTNANNQNFKNIFAIWDGQWMISLAERGYTHQPYYFVDAKGYYIPEESYAFFPGYPFLIRLVEKITPFSFLQSGLIINFIASIFFVIGLVKLSKIIFKSNKKYQTYLLVFLISASPLAVVFHIAYTEPVFLALAVWALAYILEKKWIFSGIFIAFAGLVRPSANALILAMLVAIILSNQTNIKSWIGFLTSLTGISSYLLYVANKTQNLFGWFEIQKNGWQTEFDFGKNSYEFINYIFYSGKNIAHFIFAFSIISSLILFLLLFKYKIPTPLIIYTFGIIVTVILSNGLISSRPRLMLVAFPLFIPIIFILEKFTKFQKNFLLTTYCLINTWIGAYLLVVYPFAI